ncbi:MAG: hypothetical protein KAH20_11110 [Methylococcales bacterium]|nr:hypothetical protein [Methylococcales bacterium]
MRINLLCLCVFLVGLNGCAKNEGTFQSNNDTLVSPTSEATIAKKGNGSETLVIKPIVFSKEAFIKDAIKNECKLEEKLTQFIEQNATEQYSEILINSTQALSNAQILTITIQQASGVGFWGGGGKNVGIQGSLSQNGQVIGSFKALRTTGGGVFGGYKGVCAKLGRCVRTLGKDVAKWLEAPIMNATLGNF